MNAELLRIPPVSGVFTERQFDVSARNNVWVRFEDADGGAWVGVFGASEPVRLNAVLPFGDDAGRTVLVVAGGEGYIVDTVARELIRRTPWNTAQAAVSVPERDFVVVATYSEICAVDRSADRLAWEYRTDPVDPTRRVRTSDLMIDEIEFIEAAATHVRGKLTVPSRWNDVESFEFELSLPDLELTRRSSTHV